MKPLLALFLCALPLHAEIFAGIAKVDITDRTVPVGSGPDLAIVRRLQFESPQSWWAMKTCEPTGNPSSLSSISR